MAPFEEMMQKPKSALHFHYLDKNMSILKKEDLHYILLFKNKN